MKSEVHVTDEVVTVGLSIQSYPYLAAIGWAKKHPKDKPDPTLGLTLATKRALTEMLRQVDEKLAVLQRDSHNPNPVTKFPF